MALEYEDQWDDFLDTYQKVKSQADQLKLIIVELIEKLDEADKAQYLKTYKEVIHGASISDS